MSRFRVFFILLILCGLAACARHNEFPTMLELVTSPMPESLVVTSSDDINYLLDWTISDATNLSFYLVYTKDASGFPSPLDSTTVDSVWVNTLFPTPGIEFGVSSVSIGNVESAINFASKSD